MCVLRFFANAVFVITIFYHFLEGHSDICIVVYNQNSFPKSFLFFSESFICFLFLRNNESPPEPGTAIIWSSACLTGIYQTPFSGNTSKSTMLKQTNTITPVICISSLVIC
jgi:hypothetical protein